MLEEGESRANDDESCDHKEQASCHTSGKLFSFLRRIPRGTKSPKNDRRREKFNHTIASKAQKSRTLRRPGNCQRDNNFDGHPRNRQDLKPDNTPENARSSTHRNATEPIFHSVPPIRVQNSKRAWKAIMRGELSPPKPTPPLEQACHPSYPAVTE